jgi:hypothetical protein
MVAERAGGTANERRRMWRHVAPAAVPTTGSRLSGSWVL